MELDLSEVLKPLIPNEQLIPSDFFSRVSCLATSACYLVSCGGKERFLYISPSFQTLTGYTTRQFHQESLPLWFSRIHRQDLPALHQRIEEGHQHLFSPAFDPTQPNELLLEYRFQRADGSWIWIREAKHIVGFNSEGKKDFVLVSLLDITGEKERQLLLLREQAEHHPLLHQTSHFRDASAEPNHPLTKRGKEVLSLLATGLSTKEIGRQLFVSDNTVETHRRHLLEKFNVRNTAELISKAAQTYWI